MTPTQKRTKDIEKSSHLNMKAFTTDTPHIKRYIINPQNHLRMLPEFTDHYSTLPTLITETYETKNYTGNKSGNVVFKR